MNFSKDTALTVKELNWTNQNSTNCHPANHLGCPRGSFFARNSWKLQARVFDITRLEGSCQVQIEPFDPFMSTLVPMPKLWFYSGFCTMLSIFIFLYLQYYLLFNNSFPFHPISTIFSSFQHPCFFQCYGNENQLVCSEFVFWVNLFLRDGFLI